MRKYIVTDKVRAELTTKYGDGVGNPADPTAYAYYKVEAVIKYPFYLSVKINQQAIWDIYTEIEVWGSRENYYNGKGKQLLRLWATDSKYRLIYWVGKLIWEKVIEPRNQPVECPYDHLYYGER